MKDGIIKADGTSRLARSVADFKAKYPTYDAFASALVAGTLPLDILFNEAGWAQLPDFLNQANLLKEATATLYGKGGAAVPDEIFALIPSLLDEKLSMDLLWTNASPTSTFGAQTITKILSEYTIFIIETYNPGYSSHVAVKGHKTIMHANDVPVNNMPSGYTRMVTFSDSKITFDASYYGIYGSGVSNNTDNSRMIPQKIYGIKGVQA